jgi:hypothetical protein
VLLLPVAVAADRVRAMPLGRSAIDNDDNDMDGNTIPTTLRTNICHHRQQNSLNR